MPHNGLLMLEFETDSGNEYVYDGVTNRVFCTPAPMRAIIRGFKTRTREETISELSRDYDMDTLDDYYDQAQRWADIDHAFFYEEPTPGPPVTEELDRRRRRECRRPTLAIIMTSDCNLRCKYCVQDKTKESVSYATAKEGIDRFLELNADPARKALYSIGVTFYGGEPLLEFDLVRQCVEYLKSRVGASKVPIVFTLSTNGTLLTDAIVDFLAENEVAISVSLDGPKDENDRNRVTAGGAGTFDLVYGNLMRIRQRHPQYYAEACMVSAVYDYTTDLRKVVEWFHENRSILPRLARASLACWNEKTCDRFTCDMVRDAQCRLHDILSLFKEALVSNDRPIEKIHETWRTFLPHYYPMTNRRHVRVWRLTRPGCYPGLTRLALYPDGTFRACDRIETCESIGDVHRGIDVQAVARLVAQFKTEIIEAKGCHTCIAQHGCQTCFLHTVGGTDSGFSCEGERAKLEANLKYWFSVFEANPEAITLFRHGKQTVLQEFLG